MDCCAFDSANRMGGEPSLFLPAPKTGCNVIDLLLRERANLPKHPLKKFMAPTDLPQTVLSNAAE